MRQNRPGARLIHHTFQANNAGSAVTSLSFLMDGLVVGSESTTVNVGFPRSAKLVGVFTHAGCLVVNSVGDWTLRIRVNGSGSDSATFGMPMAAVPGSKTAGQASSQLILQAGDTYHVVADGPSRNFAIARVCLEWEVL